MKFKITNTENEIYGCYRERLNIEKYPQLKDKIEITNTFCKKNKKTM